MTGYPQRIEAARADVDALLKDAQELQRLHDERAGQLEELKASGSRDFARMAELEGQRAVLATMYADQQAEVGRARDALAALEAAQAKGEALEDLRARAARLEARRRETDGLLSELGDFLTAHLARITAARVAWHGEREEALSALEALYTLPRLDSLQSYGDVRSEAQKDAWHAALREVGTPEAFLLSPLPAPMGALTQGYLRPSTSPGVGGDPGRDAETRPLTWWLDAPVTLTIAAALQGVDEASPHPFKGLRR